jgi:hypothetical protein
MNDLGGAASTSPWLLWHACGQGRRSAQCDSLSARVHTVLRRLAITILLIGEFDVSS